MNNGEDFYFTIESRGQAEYKDRGSRFIAFAFPIQNRNAFKSELSQLKDKHPSAAHHCFAYRLGTDANDFRSSDDGEPSGTAGKPILGQIDSRQLTNVAIIVVRYFGGTLLGVPGLINAYKTVAALTLQTTPIVKKNIEIKFRLQFDYTRMNEVMTIVKKYNCTVISQQMDLFCAIDIGVQKGALELVLLRLREIKGLELERMTVE
jgi:uncharacterized YigZ family protein